MKKCFLAVIVAILLVGVVNVNAGSAAVANLLDALEKDYIVDGKTVSAKRYSGDIEAYVQKYEISDEHANYIVEKINYIVGLAQKDKATSFTKLSSDSKKEAVKAVRDIKLNTSVIAELSEDGVLTIYESDGKTVFTRIVDGDRPRKTGSDNYVLVAAGFITVLGAAYVTKKVAKANA